MEENTTGYNYTQHVNKVDNYTKHMRQYSISVHK